MTDWQGPNMSRAWNLEIGQKLLGIIRAERNNEMNQDYDVIIDEVCPEHGGRNFAYQYRDENFVRLESFCEGCQQVQRQPIARLIAERDARLHGSRPQRPPRK